MKSNGDASRVRWLLITAIFFLNATNGIAWLAYNLVSDKVALHYNTSSNVIQWLSIVFLIGTFVLIIPTMSCINHFSIRKIVFMVCLVQFLSGIIKIISTLHIMPGSFLKLGLIFTGQILMACVQPFILILPTTVSIRIFSEKEKNLANDIGSVGNIIGFLFSGVVATNVLYTDSKMTLLEIYNFIPNAISLILVIFYILFDKNMETPLEIATSLFTELKMLIKNKKFLALSFSFGALFGGFSSLLMTLNNVFSFQEYNDKKIANCIAIMISVGVICSVFVTELVDKFGHSVKVIKILQTISVLICFLGLSITNIHVPYYLFVVFTTILAVLVVPLIALYLVKGSLLTKPISEVSSSGIQWLLSQVIGAIVSIALQFIPSKDVFVYSDMTKLLVVILPILITTFVLCFTVYDDDYFLIEKSDPFLDQSSCG